MSRFALASSAATLILLLLFGTALGRAIERWPHGKLFKQADLIIIVTALSVRDAKEADKAIPPDPDAANYLVGVVTTLKIEHVVKGLYKDERLELVHFRLKEGSHIDNGPSLVEFQTKPQNIRGLGWSALLLKPEYMLFLKKSKDGRYEFVSGQFDPKLSVKQILEPLP